MPGISFVQEIVVENFKVTVCMDGQGEVACRVNGNIVDNNEKIGTNHDLSLTEEEKTQFSVLMGAVLDRHRQTLQNLITRDRNIVSASKQMDLIDSE